NAPGCDADPSPHPALSPKGRGSVRKTASVRPPARPHGPVVVHVCITSALRGVDSLPATHQHFFAAATVVTASCGSRGGGKMRHASAKVAGTLRVPWLSAHGSVRSTYSKTVSRQRPL